MFRPQVNSRSSLLSGRQTSSTGSGENSTTTIREIRSRTVGFSTANSAGAKHLLANKRQAMSMERLNSVANPHKSSTTGSGSLPADKDKNSSSFGSSNSINGSTGSSPSRNNGGLNRTASRVSRFRSAKAVFERLSSNSQSTTTLSTPKVGISDKPRGNVASRFASASVARATINTNGSPRSRLAAGSLAKSQDSGRSASNIEIHRSTSTSNSTLSQPKPQPRVAATSRTTNSNNSNHAANTTTKSKTGLTSRPNNTTQSSDAKTVIQPMKPPPKDLIDEIVLEIAREAGSKPPDADCTIQDLSNCDISGIPDTLDFDRCFQDVEMMTEEEARKLLSRKSIEGGSSVSPMPQESSAPPASMTKSENEILSNAEHSSNLIVSSIKSDMPTDVNDTTDISTQPRICNSSSPGSSSAKSKVRFSEEPVVVFNTHAVEDYDRRNDDIDPVAASAEYEIEKFKEREGIKDSDDEDFNELSQHEKRIQETSTPDNHADIPHIPHNGPSRDEFHGSSGDARDSIASNVRSDSAELNSNQDAEANKEYIQSLEREVSLKRILEQNLRDLQSQYYESVKELDEYKGTSESKIGDLDKNLSDLNGKLESLRNELSDAQENSNQLEKSLNDTKESSQVLEKKYHRAKRIIKDMQTREQSYNRREQLYQQKLDEIEFELGLLVESIDRTIYDDAIKFFNLVDVNGCQRRHQVKLDTFGLIKHILHNFSSSQSTQNVQIKQRVVSILEQQLANLMMSTNENSSIVISDLVVNTSSSTNPTKTNFPSDINESVKFSHNTSATHASHRLSQPNLPHPIGVAGQPTKLFHGLNPMPVPVNNNEPSPPQSVNSYPSSNSLNSLHNNNNNRSSNNNNNNNTSNINNNTPAISGKMRDQHLLRSDLQMNAETALTATSLATSIAEEKFKPVPDIQVPFQTNEWHEKPVSEWTTTQVSTWLLALGLDQYISKFEDRNVNGQSLINLDSTVLKGLGVLNSNDRNLLKKKIRELRAEMEKERKLVEKRMKENLKDRSKSGKVTEGKIDTSQNKSSWKKGLLS